MQAPMRSARGHQPMMVLAATTLMMAVPASSFVPCASRLFLRSAVGGSGASTSCLGHLGHHGVLRRGQAGDATGIRMADELGRIGRLAKDKLFDAKSFIEDSGKADGGINFKGAGAGAVAGGLVAGPFGAAIGFFVGKNAGQGKAEQKAAAARLGLTPEVMLAIEELDSEVVATRADYELVQGARESARKRLKKFQADADEYYERAKTALKSDNEDGARTALTLRQAALDDIPAAEKELDEASFRCTTFKGAMDMMEDRLQEILEMQRKVATASPAEVKAVQDPLIEKFRRWEAEAEQ